MRTAGAQPSTASAPTAVQPGEGPGTVGAQQPVAEQPQRRIVGTTFVFTDTDPLHGASAGNQRLVVTHQDAAVIEFNNGEYVTDNDGNRKSGRYAISANGAVPARHAARPDLDCGNVQRRRSIRRESDRFLYRPA
ncbi:hypothetical protein [Simplicispira sedimenti]|uniref:hypothetical protein n=1 Tax=Simplicispira sedimenti TaxID=2919500 RepID=UPI001FAA8C92|nr:hypothetical protein [Acidovorax sp. W1-6]